MQLTFCSDRNIIFQHAVITFYTSSVYLTAPMVCTIAMSINFWKSHWFCIPAEDEKVLSIFFFFFKPDNSIQERRPAWEIINTLGFVC